MKGTEESDQVATPRNAEWMPMALPAGF